jgi:hypothetical protein
MDKERYVPGPYPVDRLEEMSDRFADFFWTWRKPAFYPSLSPYGDLEWIDQSRVREVPWLRQRYISFTRILMDRVSNQLSALSDFPEVKALIAELSDLIGTCDTGPPHLPEHQSPDEA